MLWTLVAIDIPFLPSFTFNFKPGKYIFLLTVPALLTVAILHKDNYKVDMAKKNAPLSKFIASTNKDAVFILYPGFWPMHLSCVYNRAVFIENGFPFNEGYFKEYLDRFTLAYGSENELAHIKGNSDGEKRASFYRQLTPANFLAIADHYPIDYVVLETPVADGFKNFKPAFTDKDMSVYSVNDLKRAKVVRTVITTK
ncbi:hypothetical protein GCM10028827_28920 [Mucilaginibacter myungsuensis]